MTTNWNEAVAAVNNATSILVVTHVKPDGDAIGSLLGMTIGLREMGKNVVAAVDGGVWHHAADFVFWRAAIFGRFVFVGGAAF